MGVDTIAPVCLPGGTLALFRHSHSGSDPERRDAMLPETERGSVKEMSDTEDVGFSATDSEIDAILSQLIPRIAEKLVNVGSFLWQ